MPASPSRTHRYNTLSKIPHHSSSAEPSLNTSFRTDNTQLYTYNQCSGEATRMAAELLIKLSHFSASVGSDSNQIKKTPACCGNHPHLQFFSNTDGQIRSSVTHNIFLRCFTCTLPPSPGWQ